MFSYWNVAGYDPGDPIRLSKEFKVKAKIRMYGVDVEYPLPET